MAHPQLSIIIPVFNAASSIQALCSIILKQPFTDFELILVDDGSTDKTLNVLRGIQSKDKRVVVVSKKNGGPSSARNLGLAKATGVFCMFFDADDTIDPSMISMMVTAIREQDSELVVCGWQHDVMKNGQLIRNYLEINPSPGLITGDDVKMRKYVLRSIGQNGELYNLWNKIFRLDIIHTHAITFREEIRFGEDLIFILHYLAHVRRLYLLPNALYRYLSNSSTSVFSKSALSPEYRAFNYAELTSYAKLPHDTETSDLLNWVKWRWLLSYSMIVSKSSLPKTKKTALISQVAQEPILVAKTANYIGAKKLNLESLLYRCKKYPSVLLAVAKVAVKMKGR